MASVDHPIYMLYYYKNGLVIGNSSLEVYHNGVKEDKVQTLEHAVFPSRVGNLVVLSTGYKSLEALPNLKTVFIPNTMILIGGDTFKNCAKLRKITFEENSKLRQINHYVFYQSGIVSISFPRSLVSIQNHDFTGCADLETIEINNFFHTSDNSIFERISNNISILVPVNYPYETFGGRNVTKVLPFFTGKSYCKTLKKRISFSYDRFVKLSLLIAIATK